MNKFITKSSLNKSWIFPLLFGMLGGLLGLVLRYIYTGSVAGKFPFKNVLHSHSHIMLLGFIFNSLLLMVWTNFVTQIDRLSWRLYLMLQVCIGIFMVTFIFQGYGFLSILFSTLHLWISYMILIRLWRNVNKENPQYRLVKLGVLFFFLSSIGPYMLGPLMAFKMQSSPWYQQAIFFYLHFQYFGVFFVWMLALLFKKVNIILSKGKLILLAMSLLFLVSHSLDYSFDHWIITILGALGSLGLFFLLLSLFKPFTTLNHSYKYIYYGILVISFLNISGSIPAIANLAVENRFMLIAWLHLLFLGIYTPFIWLSLPQKKHPRLWWLYGTAFFCSEFALVFPKVVNKLISIPIMWFLFFSYLMVVLCICWVHLSAIWYGKKTNAQEYN